MQCNESIQVMNIWGLQTVISGYMSQLKAQLQLVSPEEAWRRWKKKCFRIFPKAQVHIFCMKQTAEAL